MGFNTFKIDSILVIGRGAIGLEWASMFVDFGCTVSFVEQLPQMDRDLGDAPAFSLKQRGVKVMTGSSVNRRASHPQRVQS